MKTFAILLFICLQSHVVFSQSITIRPAFNYGYAFNAVEKKPTNDISFKSPVNPFFMANFGAGVAVEYNINRLNALELGVMHTTLQFGHTHKIYKGMFAVIKQSDGSAHNIWASYLAYNKTIESTIRLLGAAIHPTVALGIGTAFNKSNNYYSAATYDDSTFYNYRDPGDSTYVNENTRERKMGNIGLYALGRIGLKFFSPKNSKERFTLSLGYYKGFINLSSLEGYYTTNTRKHYKLSSKGTNVYLSLTMPITVYRKK